MSIQSISLDKYFQNFDVLIPYKGKFYIKRIDCDEIELDHYETIWETLLPPDDNNYTDDKLLFEINGLKSENNIVTPIMLSVAIYNNGYDNEAETITDKMYVRPSGCNYFIPASNIPSPKDWGEYAPPIHFGYSAQQVCRHLIDKAHEKDIVAPLPAELADNFNPNCVGVFYDKAYGKLCWMAFKNLNGDFQCEEFDSPADAWQYAYQITS